MPVFLFFGVLIPLSIKHGLRLVFPLVYGSGTALLVILFAFLIAFGSEHLGNVFNRLSQVELWERRTAGVLFIAVGLYYCLTHIYGL